MTQVLCVLDNAGASGASIAFLDDGTVFKYTTDTEARDRLMSQARFMQAVGDRVFPRVHTITEFGYVMQRFDELPQPYTYGSIEQVISLAESKLWVDIFETNVQIHETVLDDFEKYVGMVNQRLPRRTAFSAHSKTIYGQFRQSKSCRNDRLRVSPVIHGDLTLANAMIDPALNEVRLIDPIPWYSSLYAPLVACDLGKMIQSCAGYEGVMYDCVYSEDFEFVNAVDLVLSHTTSMEEMAATLWFAQLHIGRLLPYHRHRPDVITHMMNAFGVLDELLSKHVHSHV